MSELDRIDLTFEKLIEYMNIYIQLIPHCKNFTKYSGIDKNDLPSFDYFLCNYGYYTGKNMKDRIHLDKNGNSRIVHTKGLVTKDGNYERCFSYILGIKYYADGNIEGIFNYCG